ncbi:MAG: MucB/RseB C-terminal domain-containing protein [Methylococcaceae bacterium]|jgi:sigma-E factor negative regulatory protein RseB
MMGIKCFFLAGFLWTGSVFANDPVLTARQVLEKMNHAMAVLNYQGTVAFLKNGRLEPMKYVHAADKGVQQEHLLSLNSPMREIIRDADQVSCLFKETQQTLVDHRPFEHSFLVDTPKNLDDMGSIYQFEIVGEENIAMRPSYIVAIQPKDNTRYPRKIWIEKQQFLPLKVVVYDNVGVLLEQVVFTDIEVKKSLPFVDVKFLDAVYPAQTIQPIQTQSLDQAAFVVTQMPVGFREVFFARKPMHNAEQSVDHLLLSDGFTSVSIYMENKMASMQLGLQSVGAVNAYSRTIKNFQLTVMGEVPAETVQFIAEGIKLRE